MMSMEPVSRGKTLGFAAVAGLLAGLPACAPAIATTPEVVVPTSPPPSGPVESASPGETTPPDDENELSRQANEGTKVDDPGSESEATPVKRSHKVAAPGTATSVTPASPKSCCAGMNACKGLGGCKTANNSCMGKNDCKGQGGCRTGNCP